MQAEATPTPPPQSGRRSARTPLKTKAAKIPRAPASSGNRVTMTGLPAGHYDSAGSIWIQGTLDAVMNAVNDPNYHNVLAPDETNFTDNEQSFSMITVEHKLWGKFP